MAGSLTPPAGKEQYGKFWDTLVASVNTTVTGRIQAGLNKNQSAEETR